MRQFYHFLLLTTCAGLVTGGTAQAQLYVKGFGGYSGSIESDVDGTFENAIQTLGDGSTVPVPELNGERLTLSTTGDAGPIFGAAIGYNFDQVLIGPLSPSLEFEVSRSNSDTDGFSVPVSVDGTDLGGTVNLPSSDRTMTVFALRGLVEFDTPVVPVDPYVGASVGIAQFDDYLGNIVSGLGARSAEADDATAYGIFGGATLALPAGLAAYAEVRYQNVQDVSIAVRGLPIDVDTPGGTISATTDYVATTDIDNASALIGLRWEF
ncbi:MAG: hypothetical protein AAGF20_09525 [Pseudomonadota bacterium]